MIRRLLPLAATAALALTLGGCVSLLPKSKPAELYRFGQSAAAPAAQPVANPRGVILEPIDFPREAQGDGILTVEGPGTAYISGARWVASATLLFREALDHAFDTAAPRTRLLGRGETGRTNALLNIDVIRFQARYEGQGAPTVQVAIRARLSAPDGAPIAAQDFNVDQPASANRVQAIVAAYDQATDQALTGLAKWVETNTPDTPRPDARIGSTSPVSSTKTTSETTSTTTTRRP